MDIISGLPDDVLVKILSYVSTKHAVSTSILSKRWEFLWMWLPKLEFWLWYQPIIEAFPFIGKSKQEQPGISDFLNKKLSLHRAPVIESLCLEFGGDSHIKQEDIKWWIKTAVSRHVLRELRVAQYPKDESILPCSLFTCKSLVKLTLCETSIVDVPRMVYLPSLKFFRLETVTDFDANSLQRLLSNCPILEDLWVYSYENYNSRKLSVITPSLKRLTLISPDDSLDELVIDTPSLNYLKLKQNCPEGQCLIKNMPKLREAYVDVSFPHIRSLIRSITTVKHLSVCLADSSEEVVYGLGSVFNQLEHLKLCKCHEYSSNVLVQFLKVSPNLRVLELFKMNKYDHDVGFGIICWNQPNTVPECMLSSLETFNWLEYKGEPQERDLAIYILRNACCLKIVTIECHSLSEVPAIDMLKELAFSSRASTTCQLVFK